MNTNNQFNGHRSSFNPPLPADEAPVDPGPIELSFEVDACMVGYKTYTLNWAVLAKGLNDIDPEVIRDSQARATFTFWRDAVNLAVMASFAKSWLGEAESANLQSDLAEYLTTEGG